MSYIYDIFVYVQEFKAHAPASRLSRYFSWTLVCSLRQKIENTFFMNIHSCVGGDSKTLMLVQISPSENDLSETLCSLNFASRVRGVELGPAKKQVESTELLKYKQLVNWIPRLYTYIS